MIYRNLMISMITSIYTYKISKILSSFLEKKLREITLPNIDWDDFNLNYKYISVRYRLYGKEAAYVTGDFIITKNNIFLLSYGLKRKFELIYHIYMGNLTKLIPSKGSNKNFIIFDKQSIPTGLEIKTESSVSLLTLIDDLYQSFVEKYKNGG